MNIVSTTQPRCLHVLDGVVGCLTVGTCILTSKGEVFAEDLRIGDKVLTKDAGYQHISRFSMVTVPLTGLDPVMRVSRNSLGHDTPSKTSYFMASQMVALRHPMFDPLFGAKEVLACIGDLTHLSGIEVTVEASEVTFIDLGFETPQLIFADGLTAEVNPDGQTSCRPVLSSNEAQLACDLLAPRAAAGLFDGAALH